MSDSDDMGGVRGAGGAAAAAAGPAARGAGAGRGRHAKLSDEEVLSAVPPRAGARELRVGVFVIVGIVGFLTVLYLMTSPAMFRGRYFIHTEVADAQGMRQGDPVRMRGVNIGRVYAFDLAPDGGVLLTLEVERAHPIPAPATTEVFSMGFLGGMVVSIIPGDGPAEVAAGDLLPGVSREAVLDAAGEIATEVEEVMIRIRRMLTDSTIAGIGGSALALRDLLEDLSELTDGQAAELQGLTESLRRSAESVEGITDNVEGLTGSEDWNRALESAQGALATLDRTSVSIEASMATLDGVLGRIDRGEGTLGRLLNSTAVHDSVAATLGSLRLLLDDLRENPGRYVTIEIF